MVSITRLNQVLHDNGGCIAAAARTLKLSRFTVDHRVRKSPRLQETVRKARDRIGEDAVSALHDLANDPNPGLRLGAAKFIVSSGLHRANQEKTREADDNARTFLGLE